MFTGIIENTGTVKSVHTIGTNMQFWISSTLSPELRVDQSLSHNGVCLTVEEIQGQDFRVTAIAETLSKTNLENWKTGDHINLERCLPVNGRLDGHFVQGHVDTTGVCINRIGKNGSWEFEFQFPEKFAPFIIEKGSICVNGISLTAFDVSSNSFRVGIIPYTFEHTNLSAVEIDGTVNLEFDLLGKYILRSRELNPENTSR